MRRRSRTTSGAASTGAELARDRPGAPAKAATPTPYGVLMRTHGGGGAYPYRLLVIGALVAFLAASCGGSDDDRTSGTTRPPEPNTARPEGPWTFALWTTARSDIPDLTKGDAAESRLTLDPACAAGPCDIAVRANGVDGTTRPEGMPSRPNQTPFVPYELSWDAAAGRYNRVTESPIVDDCTTAEYQEVKGGYEVVRNWVLEFRAPDGDRPASLIGTFTQKVTPTPAGEAAGCTPFEESGEIAAAPTDSLTDNVESRLAGDYVATVILGQSTQSEAAIGNSFVLQSDEAPPTESMKIEKSDEGFTMRGLSGTPAPLTRGESGWDASISVIDKNCGPEVPATETFSGLRPIALTEDGAPVLSGTFSIEFTRTPEAPAHACDPSSESGYLLLVPAQAVEPQP